MGYIDLHVHSTASDGTLTPSQVIQLACHQGLTAVALTDHDTTAGIDEAKKEAEKTGIQFVPGIELSCVFHEKEIHILGLFIHKEDTQFSKEMEKLLAIRNQRNEEMIRRFQADGFLFTWEDLQKGNPNTVITRAHFARILVEKGYASSLDQAFKQYLQYGGKYCMRKEKITPEQAMKVLTDNHAFPSLAHIMQYKLSWEENKQLISYLKSLGLEGLEVYHSSHNKNQIFKLQQIAKEYQLLPTGGSDFHGTNKPDIKLGTGRGNLQISHCLLEEIQNRQQNKKIYENQGNSGKPLFI